MLEWSPDYSLGDTFSAIAGRADIFLHEFGHGIFDLGDEYDDSDCSTHYHEANPGSQSNIWRTNSRCEDHSSYPDSFCHRFTDCQLYWYKGQPSDEPTIMRCNCPGDDICDWGPDAARQVHDVLGDYLGSATTMAAADSMTSAASTSTDDNKALVVGFHYDGSNLSITRMRIVYGSIPERRFDRDGMRMTIKDGGNTILHQFSIYNPLYMDFADPPDGGLLEERTFAEIFPYKAVGQK